MITEDKIRDAAKSEWLLKHEIDLFVHGAKWIQSQIRWISIDNPPINSKPNDWYICANKYGNYFVDRLYSYSSESGWWGYGDKEPDDRVAYYISITNLLPNPLQNK